MAAQRGSQAGGGSSQDVDRVARPSWRPTASGEEALRAVEGARRLLQRRDGVAQAVILAELLGPPRVRRPWRPGAGSWSRPPRIGS